jgi:hypothetical protein
MEFLCCWQQRHADGCVHKYLVYGCVGRFPITDNCLVLVEFIENFFAFCLFGDLNGTEHFFCAKQICESFRTRAGCHPMFNSKSIFSVKPCFNILRLKTEISSKQMLVKINLAINYNLIFRIYILTTGRVSGRSMPLFLGHWYFLRNKRDYIL